MKKTLSFFLSIVLAFSCLTCLIGSTVSAEAVNLFQNGDFKDCNISSNTVVGWKTYARGNYITVHEGEDFNYFTFTERTDSTDNAHIYNIVPFEIKKNTSYTIKFWIKTSDVAAVRFYLYEPQYYYARENAYYKTEGPWESRNVYTYSYDGGSQRVSRTDITHYITDSEGRFTRSSNSSMANLAGTEKYNTNGEWAQVTHRFTTGNSDAHVSAARYGIYIDPANTAQTISVGGFEMYATPTNVNVVAPPASDDYDLGYVTPTNGVVAAEGDKLTFTATPYGNNMFLGWYDGDELVSEDAELTYTYSANAPMTYKAKFSQSKYTVSSSMEDYEDGTIITSPVVTEDWRMTLGALQSVSDEAHTGNKSVKVTSDARWGYLGRRIRNLRPNTEYTLSFWTKMRVEYTATTDTNSYAYFYLTTPEVSPGSITSSTEGVYVNKYLIRGTDLWQQNTVTFNTGDTTEAVLWLNYCNDKVSENTLWIDDICCTCKVTGGIGYAYEDANGNEYFESQHLATPTTKLVEKGNDILAASVKYNAMNGAIVFKGWYEGETFKSSDEEYLFEQDDIFKVNLTAKFIVNNVLTGATSFEGYEGGTSLRVSPKGQGVAPSGDKWGIHENGGTYEMDQQNFGIDAVKGPYTNNYIATLDYDINTGTTNITQSSESVMPHSGDTMLGLKYKFRRLIRKLDGLKANTNYTLSFYTYNPDDWNFIEKALIANTYNITSGIAGGVYDPSKDSKVLGYYCADRYEEYHNQNAELRDKNLVRKWYKIDINFTTGADTSSLYLILTPQTKNTNTVYTTFIDDLVCYETVFNTVGNSIRAVDSNVPQALRYKFTIDNQKIDSLAGYTRNELGLLVIKNEVLGNKSLVVNGEYKVGDNVYNPIKKAVDFDKNLQYVDGDNKNTYFTAALYNIGVKNGDTDYTVYGEDFTVRPYITYTNNTDGSTLTVYGNEMSSSVFDVMYEIRRVRKSESDLDVVDGILEKDEIFDAYKDWQPRDGFFYDKEPVDEYDYTFAVIGDIQNTTEYYPDDLHYIYDWLINNKDTKNIEFVLGMGDLTNGSSDKEYNTATAQLDRLKEAGMMQSILRGNHDRYAGFNSHITQDKYGAVVGGEFGAYDNTMCNTYSKITVNGIKYLILTLDVYPNPDMVNWACGVVEANPDYNVIVTTHAYMNSNMQYLGPDTAYGQYGGQYLHDNLVVKYENIVMVLCGHHTADGPTVRMTTGEHGNQIVQMLIDPQHMETAGNRAYGMIAMFYFSNDGKKLQVEYFSAVTGEYFKEKYQFELDLHTVE